MLSKEQINIMRKIAKRLEIPYKNVYNFYREISRRVEPAPSVQIFSQFLGQCGNPDPTIADFVDFILKKEKSMKRRQDIYLNQNSAQSSIPLTRDGLTISKLNLENKAATARHLRPTIIPEPRVPKVNRELQEKVARLLPNKEKNNLEAAKFILIDMKKIHPQFMEHLDLFLAAVKRCSRRNDITVDEIWATMWEISNPSLEKPQIISTPMGGKK